MKRAIFVLFFVLAIVIGNCNAQEIGDPAPDFTLNSLDGGTFTLSEQTGKLVVIFAFGYNCGYCISAGPGIEKRLADPYTNHENYIILGVDIWDGSAGAVTNFKNTTGMDIPLLLNGSGFATNYNSVQDRLFVIDDEGKLIHRSNNSAANDVQTIIPIVNEYLGIISSVDHTTSEDLSLQIYPNPVVDSELNLSFNLTDGGFVEAKIISTDGKTLLYPVSGHYGQGASKLTIDTGSLSSGIYFVILTIDGKQSYQKILVE